MTVKHLYPDVEPSLNLDFANTKRLDPRITFSRSSTATYVGSDGLIKTAPINGARFDHDPEIGDSLGLLIEEARTNQFTYSSNLATGWPTIAATKTAAAATAPNGALEAVKLTPDATLASHYLYQTVSVGSAYTFSVYVKPAGYSIVSLYAGGASYARYDLSTGSVLGQNVFSSSKIERLANDWFRISAFIDNTGVSAQYRIYAWDDTDFGNYAGDGTSGIYIWGAQLETGTFPTSYIPTAGATVTRAADVARISNATMQNYINSSGVTCVMKTKWETSGANQEIHFSDGAGSLLVSQWRQGTLRWSGVVPTTNYVYQSNLVTVFAARDTTTAVIGNDQGAYAEAAATLSLGSGDFQFGTFSNSQRKHHILKILYYPVRLTQSQLQALSL